jgi:GNAT superfamily N-acetyltransferase
MLTIPPLSPSPADRKVAGTVAIERVLDPDELGDLMAERDVWLRAMGDSDGPPVLTKALLGNFFFLAGRIHGDLVGACLAVQRNFVAFDGHVLVRRSYQGSGYTYPMAAAAIGWMFTNTPCRKLVLHVAVDNPTAIALAERLGFTREGVLTRSFSRGGLLLDEVMFGMTDEEYRSWAASYKG